MNPNQDIRAISTLDFAQLGVADVAYIKQVTIEGETLYSLHAADGRPLGLARDEALAMAALREHDLEPVSVH